MENLRPGPRFGYDQSVDHIRCIRPQSRMPRWRELSKGMKSLWLAGIAGACGFAASAFTLAWIQMTAATVPDSVYRHPHHWRRVEGVRYLTDRQQTIYSIAVATAGGGFILSCLLAWLTHRHSKGSK